MVIVRQSRPEDQPAVERFLVEVALLHQQAHPERFRAPADPDEPAPRAPGDSPRVVLVGELAGRVVGVATVEIRDTPDSPWLVPRRFASIESLVVAPDARRRGIGRDLLLACESWAKEQGATEMELSVWDFNTSALALYERSGYAALHHRLGKHLR